MTTQPSLPRGPYVQPRPEQVKGGMRRLRLAFPIAAAVALIAMGCGGSFIGGNTSALLAGTWTLDSMTINGSTQTCPATATVTSLTSITCSRFTDQYNTDGSVVRTTADGKSTANGNFTYNGTVLTTAFGSDDHQVPLTFTSGNATFSTTQNIFGYSVVFSYVKS